MAIFDLEDVANQAIACKAVHKVGAGSVFVLSEDLLVDLSQRPIAVPFQRAYCHCVGQKLNKAFVAVEHNDFVGLYP